MKVRQGLTMVMLAAPLLALGVVPARADTVVSLAVTKYEQNMAHFCWLASAETVIRFMGGGTRSQCTYLRYANNSSSSTLCSDQSGTSTKIRKIINGYLGSGHDWSGYNTYLNAATLAGEINANKPIIVWLTELSGSYSGAGHIVTAIGYKRNSSSGVVSAKILNWPWFVGSGTNANVKYYTMAALKKNADFRTDDYMAGF